MEKARQFLIDNPEVAAGDRQGAAREDRGEDRRRATRRPQGDGASQRARTRAPRGGEAGIAAGSPKYDDASDDHDFPRRAFARTSSSSSRRAATGSCPRRRCFPRDDPTLLFTNAGMNQFKDVFLGTGRRDYSARRGHAEVHPRVGKHNDLEEVGVDTYHHTFFEMLGNWSFGDYFKEDAISVGVGAPDEGVGAPEGALWVTVFGGDAKDGLPPTRSRVDLDREGRRRSARRPALRKKDNFWEMGDTGPAAVHGDPHRPRRAGATEDGANRRSASTRATSGSWRSGTSSSCSSTGMDDGRLAELPAKHVDTGMGFERVVGVLQGKTSNYDTDLFAPIFARIAGISKRRTARRRRRRTSRSA
jgi:alanyl-tRNA synthetase